MLTFIDIDADGTMLLSVLHRSMSRVNGLACSNGGKSRHPRYGRRRDIPAKPLSAITSHPPGRVTPPPDHDCDRGRESCRAWLAKTPIIGTEDSNGGNLVAIKVTDPNFSQLSIALIIGLITVKLIRARFIGAIVPVRATLSARWGGERRPTTRARYRQQRVPGVGLGAKREAQAWLLCGGRRSPAPPPY